MFWGVGITRGHPQDKHLIERIRLPISTLIETMRPFSTPFSSYNELFVESRHFYPITPAFGAPVGRGGSKGGQGATPQFLVSVNGHMKI